MVGAREVESDIHITAVDHYVRYRLITARRRLAQTTKGQ